MLQKININNKKFWKTVKPLLSDKSVSREKINLTENEKMLTSESETAETLNNFFSNIVKKLNIPKFNSNNSVTENIKDPVFKAILKYKNHPSILAIQEYSKNKTFDFEEVNIEKSKKKILGLYVFYLHYQKFSKKICLLKCLLFFDNIFSNQHCGFSKGYSTQHSLLVMLETWKRYVDIGKVFGALLTDLSKAFD